MTNFLKSRVMYAATFYVLFSALLYTATPSVFLREDGLGYRRHGLEVGETLFPISLACYAAAIASFLIFTLIDVTLG